MRGEVMKLRRWSIAVILLLALGIGASTAFRPAAQSSVSYGSAASGGSVVAGVEPFDAKTSALRMLGGLFLCCGLFGFGIQLYKRYVLPRACSDKRRLQIVERLPLSSKSCLVLVKLDGKEMLITTGSENSRLISTQLQRDELFDHSLLAACEDINELSA